MPGQPSQGLAVHHLEGEKQEKGSGLAFYTLFLASDRTTHGRIVGMELYIYRLQRVVPTEVSHNHGTFAIGALCLVVVQRHLGGGRF